MDRAAVVAQLWPPILMTQRSPGLESRPPKQTLNIHPRVATYVTPIASGKEAGTWARGDGRLDFNRSRYLFSSGLRRQSQNNQGPPGPSLASVYLQLGGS